MTASCPGFLDRYGIWNNGFDCSSPRVCCGTETDRYCCIISTSSISHLSSSTTIDDSISHSLKNFFFNKLFCFQIFTFSLCLAITILIFVIIYQYLLSIRRNQREQRMPFIQVPLPTASPRPMDRHHLTSNRISTISSVPSDIRSRCTDTSIILNTPLNFYPMGNSGSSTSTSSSYYIFPNELEHFCK